MHIQQLTSLVLWFTTFQIAHSLLAPEPLPFDGLNKLLDARSIDIPAAGSLSKRALTWATAVAKGARLLCRLENPALLNDQSTVTSFDMLAASGWTRNVEYVGLSFFDTLEQFLLEEGIPRDLDKDDFHGVRWEHSQDSKNLQGQDVPPTGARYCNVYNVKAGFIVAYNNFGPAWMLRKNKIKTLPDIRAWSDVTFLEWQRQALVSGQDVQQLKYVIRYEIINEDTCRIIEEAAGEAQIPTPWPGLTESMSGEKGRAILGTPNGLGIAYMLATHKSHFGEKTIESVRVWWEGELGFIFASYKIGPVASSEPATTNTPGLRK